MSRGIKSITWDESRDFAFGTSDHDLSGSVSKAYNKMLKKDPKMRKFLGGLSQMGKNAMRKWEEKHLK